MPWSRLRPRSRGGGSLRRSCDCCSFGSERVVSEAELCPGLVDGAFGVSEVGAVDAVRSGSEGAAVVVWGDVVAVAVGLDGGDRAFPYGAGGVVFGAGAEDGGDVVGRVDLGGGDELALGPAVTDLELVFERRGGSGCRRRGGRSRRRGH